MGDYTISLNKEELRVIGVVKTACDYKNISEAVQHIIREYGKRKDIVTVLKTVRKEK